jgi:phosphohistidine phosphatase
MHVYVLRHADAEPHAASDAERRLTPKGEVQAAQVARFCESHGVKPDVILSSPLRRAQQTAKVVAAKLDATLLTADWLACGAEPEDVVAKLAGHRKASAVMLVGHEPDLGRLVAYLVGTRHGEAFHIRKASLTALELHAHREGGARLEFSLPVKFM